MIDALWPVGINSFDVVLSCGCLTFPLNQHVEERKNVVKLLACNVLLLLLWVSGAALCFAQDIKRSNETAVESKPGEWKRFLSPEGDFSVSMPGTPKAVDIAGDSPSPEKYSYHSYLLQTADASYSVTYDDRGVYSEKTENIQSVLHDMFKQIISGHQEVMLFDEKEIELDGMTAREWLYSDKGKIITLRTVPANGHIYFVEFRAAQRVAFKSGKSGAKPDEQTEFYRDSAKKFLTSFKIMPRELTGGPIGMGQVTTIHGGTGSGAGEADATEGEVDRMLREEREKNLKSKSGAVAEPISGGVLNGFALSNPRPVYPAIAKAARASGVVTVRVLVDEQGKVIAAQAVSGAPLLRAAAVQAARKALFSPQRIKGKFVKVVGVLNYIFVLE